MKPDQDWKAGTKQGQFILYKGSLCGIVEPAITRNYYYIVYALTGSHEYISGFTPDHVSAMREVEKYMGEL